MLHGSRAHRRPPPRRLRLASRPQGRGRLHPAQARRHGHRDPARDHRRRRRLPPGPRPVRPLPRADPAAERPPLPGRPAHPALPRRAARRARRCPRRCACPASRSSSTATAWRASCRCPIDADAWHNDLVSSYRLDNGVLHNPINDRRTTQGVFHVAEGGLPIPADKLAVPLHRLTRNLLREASTRRRTCCGCRSRPTGTSRSRRWSRCCCGPLVCPAVPGVTPREAAWRCASSRPAGWSRNLDFVESIFGNAGDPFLPENDAGLDVDHWTGHTGCVILAPHLTRAEEEGPRPAARRRRPPTHSARTACAGPSEDELYNDGSAVQDHLRADRRRDGHAHRRQLLRLLQEGGEDADQLQRQPVRPGRGGARRRRAGVPDLQPGRPVHRRRARVETAEHRFAEVVELLGDRDRRARRRATPPTRTYPDIHYVPEDARDRPARAGHAAGCARTARSST